jgi:integrase
VKKQQGYVFRAGNFWYIRFRESFVENGDLVRRQVAKKLAAVEPAHRRLKRPPEDVLRMAEQFLRPLNSGRYSPEKNVTLGTFVESVYFPHIEHQKKPSTVHGYRAYWNCQLRARCAGFSLRDFDTPSGQLLLTEIARQHPQMKRTTIHRLRSLLSAIFKLAINQKYIPGPNPMREVEVPTAPESAETVAYSLDQVLRMLNVLPEPARTAVGVAAFAGLRRGEIEGLLWEGYSGDELKVIRAMWYSIPGEPKRRASKASVPVIAPLRRLLDQHRLRAGNPSSGVVLASTKGTPISANNLLARQILPALEKAGIEWHGWHGFRRSLATNLHDLGVDDLTIQKILRHSNVAVTQKAYIKTLPAQTVSAMKRLETLIGDTSSENFSRIVQ